MLPIGIRGHCADIIGEATFEIVKPSFYSAALAQVDRVPDYMHLWVPAELAKHLVVAGIATVIYNDDCSKPELQQSGDEFPKPLIRLPHRNHNRHIRDTTTVAHHASLHHKCLTR